MVLAPSEERIHTKVNLSTLGDPPPNGIAAITAHQVESEVLVTQSQIPYLRLRPQSSRQVAVLESTSFPDSTSSQRPAGVRIIRVPSLEWPVKSHPVLTSQVRRLLSTLWAIVVSRSSQLRFPILNTTVTIFTDPDERESKALLRLTSDTNITQALAFWDSLEPDLQDWVKTLTEHERTTFISKISLRVYWLK